MLTLGDTHTNREIKLKYWCERLELKFQVKFIVQAAKTVKASVLQSMIWETGKELVLYR